MRNAASLQTNKSERKKKNKFAAIRHGMSLCQIHDQGLCTTAERAERPSIDLKDDTAQGMQRQPNSTKDMTINEVEDRFDQLVERLHVTCSERVCMGNFCVEVGKCVHPGYTD